MSFSCKLKPCLMRCALKLLGILDLALFMLLHLSEMLGMLFVVVIYMIYLLLHPTQLEKVYLLKYVFVG